MSQSSRIEPWEKGVHAWNMALILIPASILNMQPPYSPCDTENQEIFVKYLRVQTADELQKPKAQAQIEIKGGHPANICC